jgi:hypothetical protein
MKNIVLLEYGNSCNKNIKFEYCQENEQYNNKKGVLRGKVSPNRWTENR